MLLSATTAINKYNSPVFNPVNPKIIDTNLSILSPTHKLTLQCCRPYHSHKEIPHLEELLNVYSLKIFRLSFLSPTIN